MIGHSTFISLLTPSSKEAFSFPYFGEMCGDNYKRMIDRSRDMAESINKCGDNVVTNHLCVHKRKIVKQLIINCLTIYFCGANYTINFVFNFYFV
jgi:hypothetical protein